MLGGSTKSVFLQRQLMDKFNKFEVQEECCPIVENKGDMQSYAAFQAIKVISYMMKLWKRRAIFARRIKYLKERLCVILFLFGR